MRPMLAAGFDAERIREGMARHFGLTDFRSGQQDIVEAVLEGRNTVVVMPTGAGKSLCYQLPAVLLPGVTVVVSPLIALMKDQVEALQERGISATYINSSLSDLERMDRQRRLRAGEYKLVYVAPERFRSGASIDALAEAKVELFAVDEAHCISQWGHDFRPDYAQLGQIRKRLRPPRTVALTATATPEVQADIARVLLMKDPKVFVAGFDRENLFLEVSSVGGDEAKRQACAELVAEGGSGIIYCATRKAAEGLHRALKRRGSTLVLYHAGMDDPSRQKAQDAFMGNENAVAIATNAFGMGIDKPNIRFVAHFNIPKAVEAYYQEIGRAGRDGELARAVLLFNHADVYTQERLIQSSHPPDSVFADLWRTLQDAGVYDRGVQLLATQIGASEFEVSAALRFLERAGRISRAGRGEGTYHLTLTPKAHAHKPQAADSQTLLQALLDAYPAGRKATVELPVLVRRSGLSTDAVKHALGLLERSGAVEVRRPFSGRTIEVVSPGAFESLAADLGRIREQEKRSLQMLRRMTDYAYARTCRRTFLLRYFGEEVKATVCSRCDVCSGPRIKAKRQASSAAKHPEAPGQHSELAVEALRQWRRTLSRELAVPPFIVFNDKTLYALATALPMNREEFLRVKGTGETKWERFGPKVVEICLMARAAGHEPAPRQGHG